MSEARSRFVEVNSAQCDIRTPKGRAVLVLTECHNFNGDPVQVVVPHPDVASELILRLVGYITVYEEACSNDGS